MQLISNKTFARCCTGSFQPHEICFEKCLYNNHINKEAITYVDKLEHRKKKKMMTLTSSLSLAELPIYTHELLLEQQKY